MLHIKKHAINTQKNIIADLRETGTESAREKEIEKLNLMVDDCEKNSSIIDTHNISLYYEFMSDEDLKYYKFAIDGKLVLRSHVIYQKLFHDNLNIDYTDNLSRLVYKNEKENFLKNCENTIIDTVRKFKIKQSYFGIVDYLKPLDIYIEEIKNSQAFKNYILTK